MFKTRLISGIVLVAIALVVIRKISSGHRWLCGSHCFLSEFVFRIYNRCYGLTIVIYDSVVGCLCIFLSKV